MASMPGYELTEPWLTEEGLPKKGIWDVVYYAGEGKGEKGCKPMPKLRRSLLQLVRFVNVVICRACNAYCDLVFMLYCINIRGVQLVSHTMHYIFFTTPTYIVQVFIEECDVQSEADKEAGVPPLLFGESFMMANQGMVINSFF